MCRFPQPEVLSGAEGTNNVTISEAEQLVFNRLAQPFNHIAMSEAEQFNSSINESSPRIAT